jgi:tRNA dimethylallyltransferase
VLERPVAELDARIAARTRAMLAGGWIEETRALMTQHDPDCPGLGSLGYREIVAHLCGTLRAPEMEEAIVRVTRQYAKRQRTWFRKVEGQGRGLPEAPGMATAITRAALMPAGGAA